MAISQNLDPASLNAKVKAMCVQLRDQANDANNFITWFTKLSDAEIASAFGVADTDVPELKTIVGYLQTLMAVYYGTGTQATPMNYNDAFSVLWGGS